MLIEHFGPMTRVGLIADTHDDPAGFAVDGPTHCSGLPVSRYGPDTLAAQFADLDVVEARRVEHVTPGDTIQPFTWLLLRRPG